MATLYSLLEIFRGNFSFLEHGPVRSQLFLSEIFSCLKLKILK